MHRIERFVAFHQNVMTLFGADRNTLNAACDECIQIRGEFTGRRAEFLASKVFGRAKKVRVMQTQFGERLFITFVSPLGLALQA
jgi:hypothetical protein